MNRILLIALVVLYMASSAVADTLCAKYDFVCRPLERCKKKAVVLLTMTSGKCPSGYSAAFSALSEVQVEAIIKSVDLSTLPACPDGTYLTGYGPGNTPICKGFAGIVSDQSFYYDSGGGYSGPSTAFLMNSVSFSSLGVTASRTAPNPNKPFIIQGNFVGLSAAVHGGGAPYVALTTNYRTISVGSKYVRWQGYENPFIIVDVPAGVIKVGYTGTAGTYVRAINLVAGKVPQSFTGDPVVQDDAGQGGWFVFYRK